MERLTYDFCVGNKHCWQVKGADNLECREVCRNQGENGCTDCPIAKAFDRLAAYEEIGLEPEDMKKAFNEDATLKLAGQILGVTPDRLRELAQAEKEGRLVVLEHAAKKGEKKPPCFYNDMGQEFCLGLARGECDDEPIDRCKECWYCESTREAAEAALEEREAIQNVLDKQDKG